MDESKALSTEDFIKGLTSSSLSQFSDQISNYTPPAELGYENQPLVQPMPMAPQVQTPQPAAPEFSVSKSAPPVEDEIDSDDLLRQAHFTTQEAVRREQILKEHYLNAEQRANQKDKELLNKDLQYAQYFLKEAMAAQDFDLQSEMHSKISEVQAKLTKHEIDYENFLSNYQNILNDKPEVFNYAPTIKDDQPAYQESPARQTFRKANTWYDFENQAYNTNLVQKAAQIEQKMVNEYQLKNMTHYIESPSYFEDLNARMYKEFGIEAPQEQVSQVQPGSDWQAYQNQQQQQQPPANYFVPQQAPQFNNQQSPYPSMPVSMPAYSTSPQQPQYGPQVAPVRHGMHPTAEPYPTTEQMYSQKAFDMFKSSLNANLAPQLKNLSPQQEMALFNASIKAKGKL